MEDIQGDEEDEDEEMAKLQWQSSIHTAKFKLRAGISALNS